MTIYKTNTKNFDKQVFPYLEEIRTEKKGSKNKYEMFSVKDDGIIDCHIFEFKELADGAFIKTIDCSKEIENKLNELTKNHPMIVYKR